MEILLPRDPGKFQGTLDHPMRGIPIPIHDAIRQRSMIRANPNGDFSLCTKLHQGDEGFLDPGQLLGVLIVGVLPDGEFLLVGKVSWIDTNFLHPLCGLHRRIRFEMNVGHNRHVASRCGQLFFDLLKIRRVLDRRGSDPNDFTSDFDQIQRLLY